MPFVTKIQVNYYVDKFLQNLKKRKPLDYTSILKDLDIVLKTSIEDCFKAKLLRQIKGYQENIIEIRTSTKEREYRLLGTIIKKTFYIVHIFIKKEQKTRKKEIELTIKRLKEDNIIK